MMSRSPDTSILDRFPQLTTGFSDAGLQSGRPATGGTASLSREDCEPRSSRRQLAPEAAPTPRHPHEHRDEPS